MAGPSKTIPIVGFLLLFGCSSGAPIDPSTSRISVTFVEPEKFTDAHRIELEPPAAGLLDELRAFLTVAAARYLPENMRLNIRISDVDLAGDFELFRGPQADHVRIVRGLYPPRIALEFEVLENGAQLIKSGKRDLTDLNYQMRSVYPREDYLRYEKDILRDWLRDEFGVLKSGKIGWISRRILTHENTA